MSVSSATSEVIHRGIKRSETITEIAKALLAVQSEMPSVVKDSDNPFFKSKYASFPNIWHVCQPILAKNNLLVSQSSGEAYKIGNDTFIDFFTDIIHSESGEWMEAVSAIPLGKVDPQGYGSTNTYSRRYCLAPLIGIVVDDDDDGNAGSGRTANHSGQQKPQEPSKDTYYQKVRAFLIQSGCDTKEKANTVLDFILQGQNSGSIQNEENAAAILKAIEKAAKNKEYTSDNVLDKATVSEEATDAFPI